MKNGLHILLFVLCSCSLFAQTRPEDKSILNYAQVLFEYPEVKDASIYQVSITPDSNPDQKKEFISSTTVRIVDGLSFGRSYTWRVSAKDAKGKTIETGPVRSFSIKGTDLVNTALYRMRITYIDPSIQANELVLIDYNRIAINRKGEPVWYLPDIKNKVNLTERIRDLRMTPQGTFTFLNNRSAIECDMNGNVLWEAPPAVKSSRDSAGFYHHCFMKLKNGHYMVLGNHYEYKPIPATYPESKLKKLQDVKTVNGTRSVRIEYGSVMEFNAAGELVWFWDSEKYLSEADLFAHGTADTAATLGAHMNAFDVDEEGKLVSVGFRDLSRIIVIDKATGNVIMSFGEKMPSGEAMTGDGLFSYQHDARFMKDGGIGIFNNNDIIQNPNAVSSVLILPLKNKEVEKAEWSFLCNFDSLSNARSLKGGGIHELDNGNLLVSMGNLNRIFEVSPEKKIMWDGFYEQYSRSQKNWIAYPQYRVSPAASLYPNYFSASAVKTKSKKTQTNIRIRIKNEGSSADRYRIIEKDETGKILNETEIKTVESGSVYENTIIYKKDSFPGLKKLVIEIVSLSNPKNTKKLACDL